MSTPSAVVRSPCLSVVLIFITARLFCSPPLLPMHFPHYPLPTQLTRCWPPWETQRETPRTRSLSVQPSMTQPAVSDKSWNCSSHCQGNCGTEAAPICARGAKLATSFSCVALQARVSGFIFFFCLATNCKKVQKGLNKTKPEQSYTDASLGICRAWATVEGRSRRQREEEVLWWTAARALLLSNSLTYCWFH